MASYFRLQDLTTVSGNKTQDLRDAIDVGAFRHVTIYLRKPVAASAGSLQLQTASVNEEDFYINIGSTGNLSSTTAEIITITDPLRFLRWSSTGMTGGAQFLIDAIGRES